MKIENRFWHVFLGQNHDKIGSSNLLKFKVNITSTFAKCQIKLKTKVAYLKS